MTSAETFRRLAMLARHVKAVRLQAETLERELMKLLTDIANGKSRPGGAPAEKK